MEKPPLRTSLKHTPLGASLPSLSNPSQVLSALFEKRQTFLQMNSSAEIERVKTASRMQEEREQSKRRLNYMRNIVKTPKRRAQISRSLDAWEPPPAAAPTQMFWTKLSDDRGPLSREGASLTAVGKKVLLFGGASHVFYNDTWQLSEGLGWKRVGGSDVEPRTGHSAVCFNQQVVVTGGETTYDQYSKHRYTLGTVSTLEPELAVWHQVSTLGQGIGIRRFHCSADAGHYVFIHGGMNEKSQFLGDCAVLSLSSLKWRKLELEGDPPSPQAFHTAVGVFLASKGPDVGLEPGIYVFGGMDSNGKQHNGLYLVKQGSRAAHWRRLVTQGTPPEPRCQHSMTYFPGRSFFVVFGGRQDTATATGYRCFADMFVFNLMTSTWSEVRQHGSIPEARCSHAAACLGSRLVVFGGINNSHYCANTALMAETDTGKVAVQVQAEATRLSLMHNFELFKLRRTQETSRYRRLTRRCTRDVTPFALNRVVTFSLIREDRGS